MDLHDARTGVLGRQRELDLAVESAGPQQRRVEDVDAVGRGDDLDPVVRAEAVELVEQLEHGPLDLAIARLLAVEALGANRVELVDLAGQGRRKRADARR